MIQKDFTSILSFFLQMILVWIVTWLLFYFFRQYGIDEYPYVNFAFQPNRVLHLSVQLGIGILTGILYGASELFFERTYFHRHSYGRLILIKTFFYLLIAIVLMSSAVIAIQAFQLGSLNGSKVWSWLISINFLVALTYFMTASILISFIRQMNNKFGPGVLMKILLGKYHHPREEERIFMFLDLRSSTSIAEKLGHIRFSKFIQDCFFDLTEVVLRHKVDIYQYVGDEAILSWTMEKGLKKNHCLHCYFDFLSILRKRRDYYQNTYGVIPFFKAGMHLGLVTVAEVGVVKKEIAYHGDVLNTAARIQGKCNELGKGLLVSNELLHELELGSRFSASNMGMEVLRGKKSEVAIFGIDKKP